MLGILHTELYARRLRMGKTYEGNLIAEGMKFGIVVSRFNDFLTKKLLDAAVDTLKRHGAKEDEIDVAWVTGSFEIPLGASAMLKAGKYDAVICLGVLIRGATPHFEYIANEAAKGIAQLSLSSGKPVVYGIVTADNIEQAIERSGTKLGNRGKDAAETAIEMANVIKKIK